MRRRCCCFLCFRHTERKKKIGLGGDSVRATGTSVTKKNRRTKSHTLLTALLNRQGGCFVSPELGICLLEVLSCGCFCAPIRSESLLIRRRVCGNETSSLRRYLTLRDLHANTTPQQQHNTPSTTQHNTTPPPTPHLMMLAQAMFTSVSERRKEIRRLSPRRVCESLCRAPAAAPHRRTNSSVACAARRGVRIVSLVVSVRY